MATPCTNNIKKKKKTITRNLTGRQNRLANLQQRPQLRTDSVPVEICFAERHPMIAILTVEKHYSSNIEASMRRGRIRSVVVRRSSRKKLDGQVQPTRDPLMTAVLCVVVNLDMALSKKARYTTPIMARCTILPMGRCVVLLIIRVVPFTSIH